MPGPNYLTRDGAARLSEELRHLLRVERPRVVQEVSEAAAQGDRSENAEYIYGKKRLREIDRRVRYLTRRLESARVVQNEGASHDTVRFGAVVTVSDSEGARRCYQLVGPDEVAPADGRVSYESPLGRALLRRKVGDIVVVQRPAGEIELEVLAIEYP
jgi:transcription elongation factor GreB